MRVRNAVERRLSDGVQSLTTQLIEQDAFQGEATRANLFDRVSVYLIDAPTSGLVLAYWNKFRDETSHSICFEIWLTTQIPNPTLLLRVSAPCQCFQRGLLNHLRRPTMQCHQSLPEFEPHFFTQSLSSCILSSAGVSCFSGVLPVIFGVSNLLLKGLFSPNLHRRCQVHRVSEKYLDYAIIFLPNYF